VPQSQEKTPEQTTELPNPELNPLLNPTLGRHLGRWAQVYFTSPPEKREEAVEELLRELQGEPAVAQETAATRSAEPMTLETAPLESIRIVEDITDPPSLKCEECGHPYKSPQRFCGMCGATLEGERGATETVPQPHLTRRVEPLFTHADLPSLSPVDESLNPPDDYSDIRWLREKSLADSGSSWGRARYAPAVIAVLAIGILFYAQSRPQKAPGQQVSKSSQTPSEGTKPVTTPTPKVAESAPTETPPTPTAAVREPAASAPAQKQTAVSTPSTAPPIKENRVALAGTGAPSDIANQATASLNAANGAAELAMAEDFLNGKTHPRNSEEAAKYLWRAVGKENPTAILLLSDMYQVGDGVPKSCDQARLLLSAAAKKGVPQAAAKLGDLLRSGCPK
jgi:hypothetical protein